jgi:hypothetical protein
MPSNPYQASHSIPLLVDDEAASAPRLQFTVWLLAYLFPIWLVLSFYSTWVIAWIQLGHRPRPNLDDPKFIGGLMDLVHLLPGLMLIAMPVSAPLGLASAFYCPARIRGLTRFTQNLGLAVLYTVLCTLALVTLRADPGRVVYWWFD